jgi:hypothetical protein
MKRSAAAAGCGNLINGHDEPTDKGRIRRRGFVVAEWTKARH